MVMVVISRNGVLFLLSWELMALAAFFAATAENDKPEVAKAGWIYLVATHIGTLFLFAMFTLWAHQTGSFDLTPQTTVSVAVATTIFALGLVGFGFKAGLMPLHVWLPGAHAHAPSHVSAVMSGVMLKMGIYGILRMTSLLPIASEWWGVAVLVVGGVTALGGILFALGQQDIKKLLAYSSIENIGIISMGIGLALLGRYYGRPEWVLLGMGASLFHVLNHGLFKPLLFLGAGALIHSTHTRDLNKMGGLGQKMPRLMVLFLVGAVAISCLPPLNGFASEWLLYLGFFSSLTRSTGGITPLLVASAAAVLALIGALVLACFVKLFGTVFLGTSRTVHFADAHDPGWSQRIPMTVLAAACVVLGFFPALVTPVLDRAIAEWSAVPGSVADLAPMGWLGVFAMALLGLVIGIVVVLAVLNGKKKRERRLTWDCGYAEPTARMQYTGSSLSQSLVGLFGFILHPRQHRPRLGSLVPGRTVFRLSVPDFVLQRLVLPLFRAIGRQAPRIHVLQQGQTQIYILYVFVITIALMLFGGLGGPHG